MHNPFTSERDAFAAVVVLVGLVLAAVVVGVVTAPAWGAAVFGAGLLVVLARALRRRPGDGRLALREAAEERHAPPARPTYHMLVVANESLAGKELRHEILRRMELWPEMLVVAPALSSRSHVWTSDTDRELEAARARLDATLAWAAEQGFEARGTVGDPDPMTAIEDALRSFDPDEIVIATHPAERSSWLESGLVERVREQVDVPVTQVVVDLDRARVEIDRRP